MRSHQLRRSANAITPLPQMMKSDPMESPMFRRLFGKYDEKDHAGLLRECEEAYQNSGALLRSNIPWSRVKDLQQVIYELMGPGAMA